MPLARIGIGANLGDARRTVESALQMLSSTGRRVAVSSLFSSKAWGVAAQPDFINTAAMIETDLSATDLLHELQAIERRLGREKTYHWGPRVIDLDILTYGQETIRLPQLIVPHPQMFERAFVLAPLAQFDSSYTRALQMLSAKDREQVKPIEGVCT